MGGVVFTLDLPSGILYHKDGASCMSFNLKGNGGWRLSSFLLLPHPVDRATLERERRSRVPFELKARLTTHLAAPQTTSSVWMVPF